MRRHPLTIAAFAGFGTLAAFSCGGDLDLTEPNAPGNVNGASQNPLVGVDCPAASPQPFDACGTEGSVCGWQTEDTANAGRYRYTECACNEVSAGNLQWQCYRNVGYIEACAATQPESGDPCFGSFGTECHYPERVQCTCSAETGAWSCENEARVPHQMPPSSPNPNNPIDRLSASERAAWCDWFAMSNAGPGYPPNSDGAVDENGFAAGGGGCAFSTVGPFCAAAVPYLSSAHCAANLALSTCQAPISELGNCVTTMLGQCWPLEHGCPRYLEKPGCSGTIVLAVPPGDYGLASGSPPCSVRVE
jgi:hypothetical protein